MHKYDGHERETISFIYRPSRDLMTALTGLGLCYVLEVT